MHNRCVCSKINGFEAVGSSMGNALTFNLDLQFTEQSLTGRTIYAAVSRLLFGFQAAAGSRQKDLRENLAIEASCCSRLSTIIGVFLP